MDADNRPKLPSIHLMLQGIPAQDEPRRNAHKRNVSDLGFLQPHPDMGLPGYMQKLRISPEQTTPPSPSQQPQPVEPTLPRLLSPPSMLRPSRNMHARSFSDYSHPYPPLYTNSSSSSNSQSRGSYHRRAISTNTFDLILQRPPQQSLSASSSSCTSNTLNATTITHPTPSMPSNPSFTTSSPPPAAVSEEEHDSDCSSSSSQHNKTSTNNKYRCEYCNKGFSRPSSLRIHTYSHTGEKPFVCPEDGCMRKFSVQSNMRRHLRVHRLGRTLKRSGPTTARNKPLLKRAD